MPAIASRLLLGACLLVIAGPASAQTPAAAPAPAAATAPPLPGPLDCSFDKAFLCEPAKGCATVNTLGELPLPGRMLVHFEKQIIASTAKDGMPHVSGITSVASAGDSLVLQGVDGTIGWVIQTLHKGPAASFTAVDHDSVLTAFGTCKPAE
ncbi:hypothetical protein [Bosea sp. 117]|uniref:hypothetical protein n=1 Tax=Bosea sp. 117 TaxID=1125973 RepID=UPI00068B8268|nr:hypothetical protein [Bosea sp. 117]